MINFHIITVCPDLVMGYLKESIIGRAIKNNLINVQVYNLRDFTLDKHQKVDDRPFGGGPGMLLSAEPILLAVASIKEQTKGKKIKTLIMAPGGTEFSNGLAKKWSRNYSDIILIAGRYEGIDARVQKILKAEEITIGSYILTGGELPALVILDVMSRQIPGVLGSGDSLEEKRSASSENYTRPEVLEFQGKKYKVPKVLLSGHHKDIEAWRSLKNKKGGLA
ncbi:MAG TPA: tRNA (guanosine(37)-N1)-methyltransferase TrmD [Candidatus Paceibacterota bacterium]